MSYEVGTHLHFKCTIFTFDRLRGFEANFVLLLLESIGESWRWSREPEPEPKARAGAGTLFVLHSKI